VVLLAALLTTTRPRRCRPGRHQRILAPSDELKLRSIE
jgi:hypothetical protein